MMMEQGLEEVKLNPFEYCFLTTDTPHSASSFQVHIPKVMPQIGASDKKTKTAINNNIFANASDCRPQSASTITTQGFLTIGRFRNTDLEFKADITGIIRKGAKFIAVVMDSNIRDMYVTDNI